jgi:hypothetical protein
MPPLGFEPIISAGERPQIYALERTVTGIGLILSIAIKNIREVSLLEINFKLESNI